MTRARAMEDQLASMAEHLARHESVISKLDALCSTVQQHSDSFDLMRKTHTEAFDLMRKTHTKSFDFLRNSLSAQQTIMADMMHKLQQFDKSPASSSTQPLLLPLPTSTKWIC